MRIVTFGEGMIEIAGNIGSSGLIGYGGDVLNVTVALARLGYAPAFMTAIGVDPWSVELADAWAAEGIDLSLVARHPDRVPGLYGIRTDAEGERTFIYWRGVSAARFFFQLSEGEAFLERAAVADVLFLSGITLSLYNAAGQQRINALAAAIRARGGMVVFDGNYRPSGWHDAHAAAAAFAALAPHISLALPTADDEAMLHGRAAPDHVARRWHAAGAHEVVVKLGAEGAYVSHGGSGAVITTKPVTPVDTTGAGDAFDAGYLAARLAGQQPESAAAFGHRLAGETILHRGAIPPRAAVEHLRSLIAAAA